MLNSTTNTYTLKREILTFSKKISKHLSKPERKFTADMTYGMLASQSCLLTDIVDQLHENSKKVNSVERLTRHLNKGIPKDAQKSYLTFVRTMVSSNPIIHIDDSNVIKPEGRRFEALGLVRDGSKSTNTKTVYEKGYHVTEACVLTGNNHPVKHICLMSIQISGLTSSEFCEQLLREKEVAIIPGSAFGASGEGYARISYAYSVDHLQTAMKRIREFLTEHGWMKK